MSPSLLAFFTTTQLAIATLATPPWCANFGRTLMGNRTSGYGVDAQHGATAAKNTRDSGTPSVPSIEEKYKIIVVTMPNCVYCDRLKNETLADPGVDALLKEFDVETVDRARNPERVKGYAISIYPSLVLVSPTGVPVGKINGFISANELARQLQLVRDFDSGT